MADRKTQPGKPTAVRDHSARCRVAVKDGRAFRGHPKGDFIITIREGRHQFSWHKKQGQSRIFPGDRAVLTVNPVQASMRSAVAKTS
jgi:hypothetical protein